MHRPDNRRAAWALGVVALTLAACGSGSSPGSTSTTPSANAKLETAGTTVREALTHYLSTASHCETQSSPVVCLEAADRVLGGQVHTYANVLAVGHGFTATQSDLSAARNAAQTLANSLEILGDAQPTQANYDQVRNTFDVNAAITALQGNVATLDRALTG